MFIGHFGVGFAAKKIDHRPSLGTMFLAAQFLDVLWPILILLGIEHVQIASTNKAFLTLDFTYYPFSHSLAASVVWSILFGVVYYFVRKNLKGAVLLGALVFSHWILDFLTHVPDLQLFPGSSIRAGLGLWNSPVLTVVVEGLIFVAGLIIYMATTKPKNLRGTITLWAFIFFLVFAYVSNLFGSPPPSSEALGLVGLSGWILIAWAYWIDRNRVPRATA